MPPNAEYVDPPSTLGIVPPKRRYMGYNFTGDMWLEDKHETDGAEGLWRIENELYDFSSFINQHPGGQDWLSMTKGTDITEAYHTHHLSTLPDEMKKKYFVRNAATKRNAPFSFAEDGFYMTLKREVMKILPNLPKQPCNTSQFFADFLCFFTFLFAILATRYWSYGLGIGAGIFLALVTIAAHNYLHQKDNIRMYYTQFSNLSVRENRITHVLSHHLHTNTVDDLELSMFEPVLHYLPVKKEYVLRYGQLFMVPLIWLTMFHVNMYARIMELCQNKMKIYDISLLIFPLAIYVFGGQSLVPAAGMWTFILLVGSLVYAAIGQHAAHRHPELFHDGDTTRDSGDFDWGISQLDTVVDRFEIKGSHFLVLTSFGDHCLHHLFPTLDHGMLDLLYPTFEEVMEKYNTNLRMFSYWKIFKGGFQQLARITPNKSLPALAQNVKKSD